WTAAPSGGASGIQPSPTHVGMDRAPLPQAVLLRTEPHARGDGPTPRPRRPRPSPRAPRTWGWTSGVRATTFTARPSPTHVGMDRRGPGPRDAAGTEPHARGDGPPRRSRRMRTRSRAPRTWGWTAPTVHENADTLPSPTHVGMDRPDVLGECGHAPEPHARGDGPVGQTSATYGPFRAPRTWGWTDHPVLHRHRQAPSPTHAGDEVFLRLYAQSSRGVRLLVSADFCDSSENVRGRPYGSASETYIAPRRLAMSMDAPHGHGGSPESLDMGLWGKSEG